MASPVDICNLALGKLGAERITNIDNPQTDNEQLCSLFYPIVRDMMLEQRDWSFLMKRATLSVPDATPPNWGYGQSFTLPVDTYRVIDCRRDTNNGAPSSFQWNKEENKIVCDVDIVYIRYITKNFQQSQLSGLFVIAMATQLAAQMAIQITENRNLKLDLVGEADALTIEASANDGMQGKHEQTHASQLINARNYGGINDNGGF
jgi:hypothetical protein